MREPFYITTPIYYVNDEPHLGHAYTTILADVLARYARLQGRVTFFLTGTDEHGQKVHDAAQKRGISPQEQADEMVLRFKQTWERLHIQYDDFIRTTEPRHVRVVETVLQKLWDKGDIYLGEYEGWYCIPDERYWTEKDLVDGNCPACGRPVERIAESNYFFRMSTYQQWLIDYITDHPDFIRPDYRRNEVLGFLRQPLGDLCITRPVSRLSWGIPLPFDTDYITYVWFDALLNYLTAAGYLNDQERFSHLWPNALHLIGKDILTTHSVYWPTMLQAAGLSQPKTIFAHGWWINRGLKMSKSLSNVVKPLDLANVYGVDAFRYFLMSDMTLGRDADFDEERVAVRYQSDLANDLGNLVHRLTNMIVRYCAGRIPTPSKPSLEDNTLKSHFTGLPQRVFELVEDLSVNEGLDAVLSSIREINRYIEQAAPWSLYKEENFVRVDTVLYHAAEALRLASLLLQPVLPERMPEVYRRLGWQPEGALVDQLSWGRLVPGAAVSVGAPLFPREVTSREK
jgi:methionyl-tRNA synthetase